jgi:outer membrane protein assembly factor BamB
MKLAYNCKKSFTVIILVIILFCSAFPSNVSAKLVISTDEGVAHDGFDDDESITMENCTWDKKSESISLNFEPITINYNHKDKPSKIKLWKIDNTLITPGEGNFLQLLSKFINPNLIPGEEVKNLEGIDYENDDLEIETVSLYWRTLNYTSYPMNLFRFTIDEEIDLIDKISVGWQSGDYEEEDNVEKITMYIWSYGDLIPRWSFIHSIVYDENVTYPKGRIGEVINSDKYVDEDGKIDILIVGTPTNGTGTIHNSRLKSDYIEVKLDIKEGYKSEGYVISDTIAPQSGKFKGWENIFWDGSEPNSNTNIKLQVLDEKNNIIESLDGNSDGFLISPIDLSSIGTDYDKIRIKALFHSDNPQFTPKLNSWGALWRTIDGFYDNFTFNYRIGESLGVDREDNDIKISKFYSEWPIFGKNSANERSYSGPDPNVKNNGTYWTTNIAKDFGGWFRSPVMKNGKIYIASNDKTISVFNLNADDDTNIQSPFAISSKQFYVESSVAISENSDGEDIVYLATSELENDTNKIYKLKPDLSVNWSRPKTDISGPICFSSSPTIAKDYVYVTSWSGRFAKIPQLYYMYSYINNILNNALGLNNYLYGFDLVNGTKRWGKGILLPAGSLSTPAVDDGIIFVGCENSQGPSLLAYEESTGNLIWNASVGMIGRSSPVIANSENGKIVIVLSREQSILSFTGEDKVFALRAETGEMLWNKTIGNESTLLRTTLLKGLDFQNLIATSEPASTPAVSGDTVFIMAPNGTLIALNVETGEMKWSFDVKQGLGGLLSSYYCASPAVVGNTVYVSSQDGNVYALDANTGKLRFDEYDIQFEGIRFPLLLYFYSSPIVTDGVVITSATELLPIGSVNLGHLICLGKYQTNSIGNIYSTPIHVQKGKWWNIFNATYDDPENSSIKFSILDSDGNTLMEDLNGSDNKISNSNVINSGIIQLCATLTTKDVTPTLHNWKVTFASETKKPVFNESSFTPDPGGWINSNKPICKIKVYDTFPGLDVSSARYRLIYKDDEKSEWYDAECTGQNGTKSNQTVTADVTKIEPAKDIKRIDISVKDLSGNKALFELADDFKLDTVSPSSFIETTLLSQYNEPFIIKANGTDSGENKSGIKTISLHYRFEGEENFTQYSLSESPFEWEFDINFSGQIEICTIATDRAGNPEEFPEEIENTFIFDKIAPEKPDIEELYEFAKIPEFSIDFFDDYLLKDVEYRLNFRGDWIKINKEDINSNMYTGEWSLNESDWEYMENDKIYFIYFRITDMAGNQYQTTEDIDALALSKDTIPPGTNVDLDLSDLEGGGWKEKYTITAYIPYDEDIDYVTLEYRYSNDNDKWSNWKQYGGSLNRSVYEWEFNAEDGSGYYEFKVKLWDYAGNYVESIPEKVSLTLIGINQIILMIALFVILLFFTKFISVKMSKKMH